MNQTSKTPRSKSAPAKQKKKSRVELDIEARDRKRQKKRRGNVAGARTQTDQGQQKGQGGAKGADPRIGSKKPVPLLVETLYNNSKPVRKRAEPKPRLTPEEELNQLENDDRLDGLLERLEEGDTLDDADQAYVDSMLDRIDTLMEQLGIELGDDEEEEEEKQEDMLQLLKRGNPKDVF